jgi:3-dehydroquinate synthase
MLVGEFTNWSAVSSRMRKIEVRLSNSSYEIRIGPGLIMQTGHWLKELGFSDKLVIISDTMVKSLYGDVLRQSLISEGFDTSLLEIPEGEEQKSLQTASRLYNELSDLYAERTTPILALGGGVIGDLSGFVAATYLRGMPLVQMPTTLLAQVDSSIGGKVAVNHGQLKNKIGTFYQPSLVVSDITALRSLSIREFSNGLAEAIKSAVVWDREFFAYLEENLEKIKLREAGINPAPTDKALEEVVFKSAKIKVEIVEKDERDSGLRNILNYGHTIGHAIETVSGFKVGHGEAIAVGMLAAARISNKMGIVDKSELMRLESVVERAGLPIGMPGLKVEEIIQTIRHDKKTLKGRTRFVLPKAIGDVFITDEVSPSLIESVLGD